MPEVYACYIVYNEADKIGLSLHSIVDHVDKVIIIDGAFALREHIKPYSTDNTKQIARKICRQKLMWVDCKKQNGRYVAWRTESEKRNEYLKLVPEGAWFYIIDADVIVTGDVAGTFKMLHENDTIDGDVIGLVKMLNFYPVLSKNPEKFPLERKGDIRSLNDWFVEDLEKALDDGTPYSPVNWIGWYQKPVMCLYRKFEGMEYRDYCARIFWGESYFTSRMWQAQPEGRKWSFLSNIIHVNMKFLLDFKEYIAMQDYKVKQSRREKGLE